jgi:hypothetical protein
MRAALAVACTVLFLGLAAAHPPPRAGTRELLRIQGHRGAVAAPSTATPLVLAALGADYPFAAADLRTFGFADVPPPEPPPGTRFTLQGARDLLVRFAGAKPDQTVTILAEHRPGSSDLFVLTLDLCPAP